MPSPPVYPDAKCDRMCYSIVNNSAHGLHHDEVLNGKVLKPGALKVNL
jgi:hypothetical protein